MYLAALPQIFVLAALPHVSSGVAADFRVRDIAACMYVRGAAA
jgi:hypothetical protein